MCSPRSNSAARLRWCQGRGLGRALALGGGAQELVSPLVQSTAVQMSYLHVCCTSAVRAAGVAQSSRDGGQQCIADRGGGRGNACGWACRLQADSPSLKSDSFIASAKSLHFCRRLVLPKVTSVLVTFTEVYLW